MIRVARGRRTVDMDADLTRAERVLDAMGEPLDAAEYDWRAAAATRLTDAEVFELTYAAHVEWATEGTFATLDISREPTVKRFLRIWLDQEVAHGELLARMVALSGAPTAPLHTSRGQRFRAARGAFLNRISHRLVGDDFFGVHMAWGAVNELTTLRFYAVVRDRTAHPVLHTLLGDVMAQEALHYSFYRDVAIARLRDNPRGQRLVRWVLSHLWSPVGSGLRSRPDVDRVMRDLFVDRPDEVERVDAALDRIPGLAGLDLVRRTVAEAAATAAA